MAQAVGADGYSIGAAAARLGVAPETLRSWGHRYGLTPSATTSGGHRRYSRADLRRLARMQQLVAAGATPARAAAAVLAADADAGLESLGDVELPQRGGPGGRVLAVPGASPESRGIARAASRLDAEATGDRIRQLLVERGAVETWQEILRPVLIAAGARWARTGEGIDVEHLLSEVTADELRAHRSRQPPPVPGRPVLLACFPEDLHVLPLHVLAAALAEARVPHRLLGARLPVEALAAAARRTGPRAVFIWRQMQQPILDEPVRGAELLAALPRTRPAIQVVVGGPGWSRGALPEGARLAASLPDALALLGAGAR
ncbi:MAG: MerR family transcriptional regulator [Jatrophihabitans sp.]|uniref:MerR family transcriptional regulator n=1 Tax=Jatrophihabitans sp. TaxID=1932789 RepID=UPI003F7D4047